MTVSQCQVLVKTLQLRKPLLIYIDLYSYTDNTFNKNK